MANADQALREDLLAEVEAAWIGRRDATVVDQLAALHPEYAEDLYEFFADLFFAERRDEIPAEVENQLGESLEHWFEEKGQHIAREAAEAARSANPTTPPAVPTAQEAVEPADPAPAATEGARESARPYLVLVEDRTGLETAEIAEKLGDDCTAELLLFTQRYPELYPPPVRREFASRTQRLFGIPAEQVLQSFEYQPELRIAASRSKGYSSPPATWEDLLLRVGLTPEKQRSWADLAKEH
jgi:hypothetical protein